MMKRIKMIFGIVLLAISLSSHAITDDYQGTSQSIDYDTYVGAGYKQNWVKPYWVWSPLIAREQSAFAVYAGWRFASYFGAEFGYEWTTRNPRSIVVPNGGILTGMTNTTGQPIFMTGRIRFKTVHADLNAFIPFRFNNITPEGIISVGVAGMKPCINIVTQTNAAVDNFSPTFTHIVGRSKAVLRVGLGLQTMVLEGVGIRALWRFENTAVLKFRNSTLAYAPKTRNVFHNGHSLFLGLFTNF